MVISISDEEFEKLVSAGIEAVPEIYRRRLENLAFIVEDEPTAEQRLRLNLYPNETLFGLYEGVPLPQRGGVTKIIPDKITIFKGPLSAVSIDIDDLSERVRHTIWHEVAHYFGLDHKCIHELEPKRKRRF